VIDCNEWKTEKTPRMHKYGESKMIRIMMATVPHVTPGSGLRKFQANGFLFNGVCKQLSWLQNIPIYNKLSNPQPAGHTRPIHSFCAALKLTIFW